MNLPGSHPLDAQNFPVHLSEDLANNHAGTDKPNYSQGDGCETQTAKRTFSPKCFCPLLASNLTVKQARNLCKMNCTKHKDQTKEPVKERNLHKDHTKEVLNQATKGEINSPECMNNYKDEIKCHISCVGRPSIKDF